MVKTPVSDDDTLQDETFVLHTLQTVEVEGVTIVDGGRAVNINGDFDISLEDDDEDKFSPDNTWKDKDEAIQVWEYLTKLQLEKAEKLQDKINSVVSCLQTSLKEEQY